MWLWLHVKKRMAVAQNVATGFVEYLISKSKLHWQLRWFEREERKKSAAKV